MKPTKYLYSNLDLALQGMDQCSNHKYQEHYSEIYVSSYCKGKEFKIISPTP